MKDKSRTLIDELESQGRNAILVTYKPSGSDGTLRKTDDVRVQGTSTLDNNATARALLAVAIQLNEHLGLLPPGFLADLTNRSED